MSDEKTGQYEEQQNADVLHIGPVTRPAANEEVDGVTHADHLRGDRSKQIKRYGSIVFRSIKIEHRPDV